MPADKLQAKDRWIGPAGLVGRHPVCQSRLSLSRPGGREGGGGHACNATTHTHLHHTHYHIKFFCRLIVLSFGCGVVGTGEWWGRTNGKVSGGREVWEGRGSPSARGGNKFGQGQECRPWGMNHPPSRLSQCHDIPNQKSRAGVFFSSQGEPYKGFQSSRKGRPRQRGKKGKGKGK